MIQRIQTIFLALAAASGFGVLASHFATSSSVVSGSVLFSDGVFNVQDNIGLLILFALAGALALAGIFLFKNRQLQLKICRIALIANVLGFALAVLLLLQNLAGLDSVELSDGLGAWLPIVYLVFGILALRYINKDEQIVKSMDRLR